MNPEAIYTLLNLHVPAASVSYCHDLWKRFPFDLSLRRSRVTKIGDFSFPRGKFPRITVNRDLHPFLFLITYIHEVAHLEVHLMAGHSKKSHGTEWKREFQSLLLPVMSEENFPPDVLTALRQHMTNPRATLYSDPKLMRTFRSYDHHATATTFLSDIGQGSIFELRGRWFRKGETKRTRVLCQEVKTRKKYLVPADAPVKNVQLSLL